MKKLWNFIVRTLDAVAAIALMIIILPVGLIVYIVNGCSPRIYFENLLLIKEMVLSGEEES